MPGSEGIGLHWVTSSREIRTIRKTGRLWRGKYVFVWASDGLPGEGAAPSVAIATGRGFSGAVSRNAGKRRVKGGILDKRELLEPGLSYLVEGRAGVEKVDYQILVNEIDDILSESHNWVKKRTRGT